MYYFKNSSTASLTICFSLLNADEDNNNNIKTAESGNASA